jgi:uncharacterized protein YkwD
MLKRLVKPLVAIMLFSQFPFPIADPYVPVAKAASVTSVTYGTPNYTRLTSNVQEINYPVNTRFTAEYYAWDENGNSHLVTPECTFSVDDPSIATVANDGTVYTVAPGRTLLHVQFHQLSMTLPIVVYEQQPTIIQPQEPAVTQSTLDVYSGVDMTRLETHRQASISLINSLRKAVGVPLLAFDESLNKAAQAHANYQEHDKRMGHTEEKGKPGYSGTWPGDRARAFGYPSSGVGETVAPTSPSPSGATQVLIDAPYHRIILLMPSFRDVGVGVSNGYTVINPASKNYFYNPDDNIIVYYPYNGQVNVPTSWLAYETPNPLQYYGKEGARVGYPISISTSSGNKLTFKQAQITDSAGRNVDYYLVDSAKSGYDYGFLLIPKEPLQPNTTYTVTASFSESSSFDNSALGTDKTNTWSFTTESDSILSLSAGNYISTLKVGESIKVPAFTANYSSGIKKDVTSLVQLSSDSSNISISNGSILGISAGTATVTASYENKTYSFKVTVTDKDSTDPVTSDRTSSNETFSDIGSHWAKDTIIWAQKFNIIDGYPDGTFKPDGHVSEAEFLAMIFRMYPDSTKGLDTDTLTQAAKQTEIWSDRFYEYAEKFNLGLQESASNPALRDLAITRAKVAQIIAKLSGKNYTNDDDAIQFLLDSGYSQGKISATVEGYAGNDKLTRAEALQFLKNLKDKSFSITKPSQISNPVKKDSTDGEKSANTPLPPEQKPNVMSHHNITATFHDDQSVTVEGVAEGSAGQTIKIKIYGPTPEGSQFSGPFIKEYSVSVDAAGYFKLHTEPLQVNGVNIYVYTTPNVSYWYGVRAADSSPADRGNN